MTEPSRRAQIAAISNSSFPLAIGLIGLAAGQQIQFGRRVSTTCITHRGVGGTRIRQWLGACRCGHYGAEQKYRKYFASAGFRWIAFNGHRFYPPDYSILSSGGGKQPGQWIDRYPRYTKPISDLLKKSCPSRGNTVLIARPCPRHGTLRRRAADIASFVSCGISKTPLEQRCHGRDIADKS